MFDSNFLAVVYADGEISTTFKEVVRRHPVDLLQRQSDAADLATPRPANRGTAINNHGPSSEVAELLHWLCGENGLGRSCVLICDEPGKQPLIASLSSASCGSFSRSISVEQMESAIEEHLLRQRSTNGHPRGEGADSVREKLGQLTSSELEVLCMLIDGNLNRTIANRMGLSERTVENRRRRIFEVFESNSIARIVRRICETVGCDEVFDLRDRNQ
jgi:DNA-binding NarL/FixJ family response regulator